MKTMLTLLMLIPKTNTSHLFQRVLPAMMMIVGLVLLIAILVSATFIAGLIAVYFALIDHGMTPQTTLLIIAISTIVMIITLVRVTFSCVERLRRTPAGKSPFSSRVMHTLEAFVEGLMAK